MVSGLVTTIPFISWKSTHINGIRTWCDRYCESERMFNVSVVCRNVKRQDFLLVSELISNIQCDWKKAWYKGETLKWKVLLKVKLPSPGNRVGILTVVTSLVNGREMSMIFEEHFIVISKQLSRDIMKPRALLRDLAIFWGAVTLHAAAYQVLVDLVDLQPSYQVPWRKILLNTFVYSCVLVHLY